MTTLEILGVIAVAPAVLLLVIGSLEYVGAVRDSDRRLGARMILSAPVWPAVFLVLIVLHTARLVRNLWKAAWS